MNNTSAFAPIASAPKLRAASEAWPMLQLEHHLLAPCRFERFQHVDDFVCIQLSKRCRVRGRLDNVEFDSTLLVQDMNVVCRENELEGELIDSAEIILITLDGGFLAQIGHDLAHTDSNKLTNQIQVNDPFVFNLGLQLLEEVAKPQPSRFYIEALALALGTHLLRHYTTTLSVERDEGSLTPQQLYAIREYIESNLSADLSLETLAALVGFSPYYFARLFKQALGITPYAYIVKRRIEAAKRLLRTTAITVEQIALSVGYSNPSHFSRTFKQHTDKTPRAYRRAYRRSRSTAQL